MKLYSSGGKYVADTKTKIRRKRPAARNHWFSPAAVQRNPENDLCAASTCLTTSENQENHHTANGRKRKYCKEWLIWLEAFLIFLTIMAATVLFLHIRKMNANKEFQALAEQIQQAEATEETSLPQPEYIDSAAPDTQISDVTTPTIQAIMPKYEQVQEMNPEFFGWIRMDGTELDCPVMRSEENNEKYLRANFYGDYSYAGTPFVDNNCTRDSDNILIYGHNLRDGGVFHSLLNYAEEAYWHEHPTIMFSDLYEDYEYEVMAAFYDRVYTREETEFRYYQFQNAASEEEYDYAIGKFKEKALYDTGVEAKYGDKLITLSTCAYHEENGRFVVIARRMG